MKKNFKFMLVALMAFFGYNSAFAQRNVGDIFPSGNYVYQVTTAMPEAGVPGEVTLIGIRDGKNPIEATVLAIPGYMEESLFGDKYMFNVTALAPNALQNRRDASGVNKGDFGSKSDAKSVTFPKQIIAIPADCFKGYTNVTSITFEENSELETIANGAFSTTQITSFDFTPCKNLASLPNEVFVEAAPATNSYITSVTLPESSKLLKDIGTAFQRLTELTEIKNLDKSAITKVDANAFNGCTKLETIKLPGTVKTIDAGAFENCGVKTLTINVNSLTMAGDGTDPVYGANVTMLESLTLTGNLGGVIATNAFKDCTNLATLDLSGLNFASLGQIATSAFEGCTEIEAVTIGDINDQPTGGYTIDDDAFKGCTKLATVTIGDIKSANAIGAAAFGDQLKTVTIGTIKAGAEAIAAGAFVYADVSGTTLTIANASGKYLSSDDATTAIFATGAFDFSNVTNAALDVPFVGPVITIGELKSKGGIFAGGDISLPTSASYTETVVINFTGNIAEGGLNDLIIDNSNLVEEINFAGNIAEGGIAVGSLKGLVNVMEITFAGSLAEKAIAADAMTGLLADSHIFLTGTPEDNTVNPFAIDAISTVYTDIDSRTILLSVTDKTLETNFKGTKGLGHDAAKFEVYEVKFYVAPTPDDDTFTVYRDTNSKGVAWGRINFSKDKLSKTLMGGTENLDIQRVQDIDGAKVKLTLYATYTDEDDNLNASTIYMIPLKVSGGIYHIEKTDDAVIIAKAEKKDADFTVKNVKIPVLKTGTSTTSLWPGLVNTELHIAKNDMTNQQLCDKTAKDGGVAVDIYRGLSTIQEDLYIMTDPAKYNGFRIDKTVIEKKTDGTGAHINKGWYYMLLQHYEGAAAAARVVWMDDAEATAIYGVKEVQTVKDGAMYNLQGVRISAPQKGQLYIMNGKKYIAK